MAVPRTFMLDYRYLMQGYRGSLIALTGWILLMQVAALAEPYALKYVVDGVLSHSIHDVRTLLVVVVVLVLILNVGSYIQIGKNKRINELIFRIERDIFKRCAEKLMILPLSFHERENAGLLISKVTKGLSKIIDITALLLYEIGSLILQTIVTAVVIGLMAPKALIVFVPIVLVFTYVTYRLKKHLAPLRKKRHEDDSSSYEHLGEATVNIATVQTFGQEGRESAEMGKVRDAIYEQGIPEFRTHFRYDYLRNTIVNVGRLTVIALCAWDAINGDLSMGTFVFVVALADRVFIGCYRIGAIFDRTQEAAESVGRLVDVLQADEEVKDPPNPVVAPPFKGSVSFSGVTHVYPVKHRDDFGKPTTPALADIEIEIRSGETIGVVGRSGGGKSTLAKLLLRVNDPTAGRVAIDGIDVKLMRRSDFRRQIGYVSQDIDIFSGDVSENIAYGVPDADEAAIIKAAMAADIHDFIMSKPEGYKTMVGNRGMRLSGGQKQRIGIARAVLKNPRILVLDEATSQIDSISDEKIHRAIAELRKDRTTIIIAHRLSTVQDADRIIVIDGRILEIGTDAELKAKASFYAEMIRIQQDHESKL
jgi:ABC-type multidrug transport system fused ATPase/permease subunit